MEQNNPLLSVVLGTYNRKSFLTLTIESIRQELADTDFRYEIIVIDGGSTDGTLRWLAGQKDLITIIQHNRGIWQQQAIKRRSWGYFMNLGFKCAQGKYVCMLSDDCLIIPGAIQNGIQVAEKAIRDGKKVGAVAFYWRNWPEQTSYWVGLTLGDKLFVNHGIYLKTALEAVGYIDETSYFFYKADSDLCLKMWQQGYECREAPDSYIEHYAHANHTIRTSNMARLEQDEQHFMQKWEGIFYDRQNNNPGGWIVKEYDDPDQTVKHWTRLHLKTCREARVRNFTTRIKRSLHYRKEFLISGIIRRMKS